MVEIMLLRNKTEWKQWLVDRFYVSVRSVNEGIFECPKFPCYGYGVVCSWRNEEERPEYLTLEQLESMTKELVEVKRKK